ncbi:hypothetical protein OIDMADRAFT_106597 [Oidiodendron maius Zn]|uniref:PXA domain-containing protein n=1 Tax=Oidiodendron maius (strain Zn) TaxID=913774 RepID=A0A0C3C803_OIDMZ|nr:hypothetical protein OIDMADRAFT_106597 [Oidiodendron maius Zn]
MTYGDVVGGRWGCRAVAVISPSKWPGSRSNTRLPSADPVSERATLFLIRRTLCSQLGEKGRSTPSPIDEILPPLTSSNEVDLQLYAFIAIIIREFVQTWYSKITPDQVFVEEVVNVIAHCTRALEQRLRNVDLESLFFDELPELLEVHVQAYRTAHRPFNPRPFQSNPREIYHSICPFPALSPVPHLESESSIQQQKENEAVYRQLLVQGVLAVLLPTEDLENDCLMAIVGQIFSEMILGGAIGGKASEPWLLWEGITKLAEAIQGRLRNKSNTQVGFDGSLTDGKGPAAFDISGRSSKSWRIGQAIQNTFWLVLQYIFLALSVARLVVITVASSTHLPSRIAPTMKVTGSVPLEDEVEPPRLTNSNTAPKGRVTATKQPILKMKMWSCAAVLLDLSVRMPWLSAAISMVQWAAVAGPGEVGNTDGILDKLLSDAIQRHILDPSLLPLLLRTARAALFPNNAPAPPRQIPSAPEQLLIRRRGAEAILSLVPPKIQEVYFGPGEERRVNEVEELLNILDDSYCNKHLMYGAVELILTRLMPELAEKGVEELLEERLS